MSQDSPPRPRPRPSPARTPGQSRSDLSAEATDGVDAQPPSVPDQVRQTAAPDPHADAPDTPDTPTETPRRARSAGRIAEVPAPRHAAMPPRPAAAPDAGSSPNEDGGWQRLAGLLRLRSRPAEKDENAPFFPSEPTPEPTSQRTSQDSEPQPPPGQPDGTARDTAPASPRPRPRATTAAPAADARDSDARDPDAPPPAAVTAPVESDHEPASDPPAQTSAPSGQRPRPRPSPAADDRPAQQDRTMQDQTKQDQTKQDQTKQDQTKQDQTGQNRTEQNRTEQDEAKAGDTQPAGTDKPRRSPRAFLRSNGLLRQATRLVIVVVVIALAALALRTYIVSPYYIPSASMEPTLHGCNGCNDDHVLVDKFSYRFHDPHAGDIVVFNRPPKAPVDDAVLIKRIVAIPGDIVVLDHGRVVVDGKMLKEPYLQKACGPRPSTPGTNGRSRWKVPEDDYFVMGDNRCNSFDSRDFGPIPKSLIIGRAFAIIWPLKRIDIL